MTECSPLICRRTALRRLAVGSGVAAAGLVAACGSDSSAPSSGGSSSSAGGGSTDGADGGGGSGGGNAGGGGMVLGPASEVAVGSGVIYSDALVVVTQPTKGDYKGFTAVCTHQ